jgi:hypothetical protein
MAERCSQNWDGFCQAYLDLNVDTYWPNEAVIDAVAYNSVKNFFNLKPTIGQDLLRNSCYRRFIYIPEATPSKQQFDNTVPNSPVLTIYNNYTTTYSRVQNLKNVNHDILIQKMLQYPAICFDVLARIYLAQIRNEINIKDTILDTFFTENKKILDRFVAMAIQFIPSFQIASR